MSHSAPLPFPHLPRQWPRLVACSGSADSEETDPIARAFAAARDDLATRFEIEQAAISIKRAEPVTWDDACLGASAATEICAQVLTDSWVIWLLADDSYRYHTDLTGTEIRMAAGPLGAETVIISPLRRRHAARRPIGIGNSG